MKIRVNDREYLFPEAEMTVMELLGRLNMPAVGVVAELGGEVFNNREFNSKKVADGSSIELIRIVGGG